MNPSIIKESSEGLARIPLEDALYQKRKIYCIGEISKESAHALVMQLRWLQLDSPGEEITLYIDSPGGEVSSGLAIYDVMHPMHHPHDLRRMRVQHGRAPVRCRDTTGHSPPCPRYDSRSADYRRRWWERPASGEYQQGSHADKSSSC